MRANYSSHRADNDRTDEANGLSVLNALPDRCVVWAYWDLRTTFLYLHHIEQVRPDLTILDSRSILTVGPRPQAGDVYVGVQIDPATAGRPVCFIAQPGLPVNDLPGFSVSVITQTNLPWGLSSVGTSPVYLVEPTR